MAEQDKIDELLDRALGEYGKASARAGLEGRVLARLESAESSRRVRWWWLAVPAMALLIVVALVLVCRPQKKKVEVASMPPVRVGVPQVPTVIAETPRRDSVGQRPSRPMRPKAPVRTSPKAPDSEPRLATFPSRDSNDQLVKLAMQFVQAHPEQALEIVQEQKEFREMAAKFTAPLKEEE